MRQVVLDTETTGLAVHEGHRIIEIGVIELVDRNQTDNKFFHTYLNPQREVEAEALKVHGLSAADLADAPLFADRAEELLAFLKGAEVLAHNAPFDVGFIEDELRRLPDMPSALSDICEITDTLVLARTLHPGQQNSLDALCRRYHIDVSSRQDGHGALVDARLLMQVYLAMTSGQISLLPGEGSESELLSAATIPEHQQVSTRRPPLPVLCASAEELAAHQKWVQKARDESGEPCLWAKMNMD